MDDFSDRFGDLTIIDSMLANRGLTVSFAAITSRTTNWQRARDLVTKGHEIVSHSVNHTQTWSQGDYAVEVDSSKAVIEREVPAQGKCLFFAFPYDDRPREKIDYIRIREYIGCRGGWPDRANICRFDPFVTNYITYGHDGEGTVGLDSLVKEAIGQGGFALREAHTVGAPGYYPIDPPDFAAHLNFCRSQVDAGELWMAPVTRAIKYMVERERFTVAITSQTASEMVLTFDTQSRQCNPSPLVNNSHYDFPLTLLVGLPVGFSGVVVTQGGNTLSHTAIDPTNIGFDADPWGGPVTITNGLSHTVNRRAEGLGRNALTVSWHRIHRDRVYQLDGSAIAQPGWGTATNSLVPAGAAGLRLFKAETGNTRSVAHTIVTLPIR